MGALLAAGEDDRRVVDAVLRVGSDALQFGYARTEGEF
jgi:hypothetical protein